VVTTVVQKLAGIVPATLRDDKVEILIVAVESLRDRLRMQTDRHPSQKGQGRTLAVGQVQKPTSLVNDAG
jgi:hypothetical protein